MRVESVVLRRLIEEVRREDEAGGVSAYNRMHNRHNRSWHPPPSVPGAHAGTGETPVSRLVRVYPKPGKRRPRRVIHLQGAERGRFRPHKGAVSGHNRPASFRHDLLLATGVFGLAALFFRPGMAPRGY